MQQKSTNNKKCSFGLSNAVIRVIIVSCFLCLQGWTDQNALVTCQQLGLTYNPSHGWAQQESIIAVCCFLFIGLDGSKCLGDMPTAGSDLQPQSWLGAAGVNNNSFLFSLFIGLDGSKCPGDLPTAGSDLQPEPWMGAAGVQCFHRDTAQPSHVH